MHRIPVVAIVTVSCGHYVICNNDSDGSEGSFTGAETLCLNEEERRDSLIEELVYTYARLYPDATNPPGKYTANLFITRLDSARYV